MAISNLEKNICFEVQCLANVFLFIIEYSNVYQKSKLDHVLGGIENTILFADIWPSSR